MGLPTPAAAVVEVRENLIEHTDDLVIQLGRGRTRCRAGLQFGSRYPGSPADKMCIRDSTSTLCPVSVNLGRPSPIDPAVSTS